MLTVIGVYAYRYFRCKLCLIAHYANEDDEYITHDQYRESDDEWVEFEEVKESEISNE